MVDAGVASTSRPSEPTNARNGVITRFLTGLQRSIPIPEHAAQIGIPSCGLFEEPFPSSVMDTSRAGDRAQIDRARGIEEAELRRNPAYSIGSSLVFEGAIVLWAMWSFTRKDY